MDRMQLTGLSATNLAQLIARGDFSALEVTEAAIARIEEVNPRLNAVVVKRYDQARADARAIDVRRARGEALPPLAGVPVTIKECLDLAGTPSTFGLQWRAAIKAEHDETHVARLRAAGAVVLGKTNVAQLLAFIETDNAVYGRTNNPWNAERTCGGSSGGEAAIIATGASSLGLGTDIGGSVRYPANFCAIASLKPTAGRCDDMGQFSFPVGQRTITSQVGVLARHVDDVALGLEVINGDGAPAIQPSRPLGDSRTVDVARLRVGFYTDDGIFRSSPAVRRAVRGAASALASAGAKVVPFQPYQPAEVLHLFFALMGGDRLQSLKDRLRGEAAHPSLKPLLFLAGRSSHTLALLRALLGAAGQATLAQATRMFDHYTVKDHFRAVERALEFRREHLRMMDTAEGGPLDLILGPVCALPAFRHGTTKDLGLAGTNSIQYNLLGYPAGVVPVTRVRAGEETDRAPSRDVIEKLARECDLGSAGLPVGVQIAARPWRDHLALAAMRVVEQAAREATDYPAMPG
jgi:fatty acid amide hydrolase